MTAYESLLSLYPRAYREQFGEEMLQVFHEVRAAMQREAIGVRLAFYFSEFRGLLWGAATEHLRVLGAPHGFEFFGKRSLYMQPERRYPYTSIVFMSLALALTVLTIAKAQGIAYSVVQMYTANGQLVIQTPKGIQIGNAITHWPSSWSLLLSIGLFFLLTWLAAIVGWGVAHALRRSGVHRLDEAQTWPQAR